MMNIQDRYQRILRDFNDTDSLLRAISVFQRRVCCMYPHAHLLSTTAPNGVVTHIGVYDCDLQLNDKGYFKPLEQPCPQLLGEHIQLGTSVSASNDKLIRLVQQLSCWLTAFHHAMALNGGVVEQGNDYETTFDHKRKLVVTTLQ